MKTTRLALILLMLLAPAGLRAQSLTTETLVDWCRDARLVFTGLVGSAPISMLQMDQRRSNATACTGYLRGWLEHDAHMRSLAPQLGECSRPISDNAAVVNAFLTVADQPSAVKMDINNIMTLFGSEFCRPAAAKTQIQPTVLMPAVPIDAPRPQAQIIMLPPPAPEAVMPPAAQIAVAAPVVTPQAMPTPETVAPQPKSEIAVVMPRVPMPPPLPQPVKLAEPALPPPEPVKLAKPAPPPQPVIDPTQTRIISSSQSRMLEADEQSAIQVIR
ncbi:MAG TPA: hypothetical protein PKW15_06825 [Alphaproteobacteria bacterium]|nr:hypothetical protein [Rhodospirillaceae bacterium]HRJ12937.1 hypothetical protein [Alphaproteobacteria bacterium]